MFTGLKALTAEKLAETMGDTLTKQEIDALLLRRDLIVKHFEQRIASTSEPAVLFTLFPARRPAAVQATDEQPAAH
jgi:hypothetical protein